MKLTIFNGSPRGKGSNTKILMDHFCKGFNAAAEVNAVENNLKVNVAYLVHTDKMEELLELFEEADKVILAFPLYTDCVPGIVKYFIEQLEPLCGRENNPDMGFVVQSGFPEAVHSRAVEKFLEKLTRRLGCKYLGTVIKGGVEGIQVQPPRMTRELFDSFYRLGVHFGKTGAFDETIIRELAKWERLPGWRLVLYKFAAFTGIANFYWNSQLKKNNAYAESFAKPEYR
ncbi:MAG: NAD(P)H-dependent oxidoreductase [Candidatus Aminicenantes bacterium]|nr:NAD(P)H-dependent oxidoreductase [Candidatus Aminicenantes bacterium]